MILSEFFHVCWNVRGCWVWILRNGSNSDNSWRTKNLSNWRVQFSWGNNSKGCSTTLLVLMSLDMFWEMVTSHKSFRTFRALKSLFTFLKRRRKSKHYWNRAPNTAWSSESHPIQFNIQSVFKKTHFLFHLTHFQVCSVQSQAFGHLLFTTKLFSKNVCYAVIIWWEVWISGHQKIFINFHNTTRAREVKALKEQLHSIFWEYFCYLVMGSKFGNMNSNAPWRCTKSTSRETNSICQ